jgi:DNA polymerase V
VYPHWQEDNPRDFKWFRRMASMSPSQRRLSGRGLPVATADTGKLTSAALHGIAAIWKQGHRYKKAGVIFLNLRPATEVQGTLFDQPDTPARKRLMRTVDSLNVRYGRDTVTYVASGRRRAWKLRSDQLSARYM